MMTSGHRLTIIVTITLAAIIAVINLGPIAQDPGYHDLSDRCSVFGIPNFFNVISNLPFIIIGTLGMRLVASGNATGGLAGLRLINLTFFAAVLLTGFGSVYYHYHPDNDTLFWDRLPMSFAFAAIFCSVVGEYISTDMALKLFVPLLVLGPASVLYWHIAGDLRLYVLIQFLPVLLIPVILCLFTSAKIKSQSIWGLCAAYAAAKAAEYFDGELYSFLRLLSGHSLKHLLAALGALVFYRALRNSGGGVPK